MTTYLRMRREDDAWFSARVVNKNKKMKKKREKERGWKKKNEEDETSSVVSVVFCIRFYWSLTEYEILISLKFSLVIPYVKAK
jgi:hypothetical protein